MARSQSPQRAPRQSADPA